MPARLSLRELDKRRKSGVEGRRMFMIETESDKIEMNQINVRCEEIFQGRPFTLFVRSQQFTAD